MNGLRSLLTATALAVLIATTGTAGETKASAEPAAKPLKAQTHCPVMGGEIDSTVYTDIQGQRVYHCCPGCSPKLVANPDLYFKKAAAQGVMFENIQTTDPVTGAKLGEKKIFTDYEGRRIYFASEESKAKFASRPAEFLKKMATSSTDDKPSKEAGSHSGHGH